MHIRRRFAACLLMLTSAGAFAQAMPADAPRGKDHPVLSRYAGSWLAAFEDKGFDAAAIPAGPKDGEVAQVEGRITRLFYVAPRGRSVLEVQRNYEQALEKAGAVKRDACAGPACSPRKLAFSGTSAGKQLASGKLDGWGAQSLLDQWQDLDDARWWYGTLDAQGTTLHVAVLTARPGIIALADGHAATLVQIVQPKAMPTGQVTVDAAALARGLQAEGRMALYGVYFDTGKSEIKPETRPQLEQMAQLLKNQAGLRVFIIGHTDNQGTLEANLALSRDRARAVVDALVKNHGIAAVRLGAAGVANYAPVASNAGEAGRAKNRRVEIVVQ